MKKFIHTFNRPWLAYSDGGPAFGQKFTKFLEAFHINHHLTSAHRPTSNGDAESGVKSVKNLLLKIGKISEQLVEESVFNVNNEPASSGAGSPAERFFLRGIRSTLPNSFKRNLQIQDLMTIRDQKRKKLASRRGRKSTDIFQEGDPVRIQDPISKRWNIKGKIESIRSSADGVQSSFQIKKSNGRSTLRHQSHVRHDITIDDRAEPSKITFKERVEIKPIKRMHMTRSRAKALSEKVLQNKSSLRGTESQAEQRPQSYSEHQ